MDHGDRKLESTWDFYFTTKSWSSGAPTALGGSPVLSCYEANSTTEITAGITLDVDFDGRTGLNHVRMVITDANGYSVGNDYAVVITTGTVGINSRVGMVVGTFSIENRHPSSIVAKQTSLLALIATVGIKGKGLDDLGGMSDDMKAEINAACNQTVLTESYAAVGVAPTMSQAIYAIHQQFQRHTIVAGTWTIFKLDGVTPAFTISLPDEFTADRAT